MTSYQPPLSSNEHIRALYSGPYTGRSCCKRERSDRAIATGIHRFPTWRNSIEERTENRPPKLDRIFSFLDTPKPTTASEKKSGSKAKGSAKLGQLNEQVNSTLLNDLPAELRISIWEYVLGGQLFHIVCERQRVGCYPCDGCSLLCDHWKSHTLNNPRYAYLPLPRKLHTTTKYRLRGVHMKQTLSLLPLLQTCRKL
jgi:hypothetical protein